MHLYLPTVSLWQHSRLEIIPQSSVFPSCNYPLLSFGSSGSLLPWQGFYLLPEPEFVSTSCRTLLCPLPPACNSSSVLVPFSASHCPNIFCTKSEPLPVCPFFPPRHVVPTCRFPHLPQKCLTNISVLCIFLATSCTYCLFHISCNHTCWSRNTTPFDASFPPFLIQEDPLFFWLRLKFFAICPLFHQ